MNAYQMQPDSCQRMEPSDNGGDPVLLKVAGQERLVETNETEHSVPDAADANKWHGECRVVSMGAAVEESDSTETPAVTSIRPEEDGMAETTISETTSTVSISFESYREEGIAQFFANEHRTFHPAGSGRASGVTGSSLIVGARHAKSTTKPSAAFRGALARKGDSGLNRSTTPNLHVAVPAPGTRNGNSASAKHTAPAGLPLPKGLLDADPGHNDRLLTNAFEQSACGLSRKDRRVMRTIGLASEENRLKKRTTGSSAPVPNALRISLPMIRVVDGNVDLSDPLPEKRGETNETVDPNLLCLIDVWPTLPRRVRDAVMSIVRVG